MIPLINKDNVEPVDSVYPFGNIKDKTPTAPGTPVNVKTYADFHQFFEKMFFESGLTANGLPDNEYNGFQLYEALFKLFGTTSYNGAACVNGVISDTTGSGATFTLTNGITTDYINAVKTAKRVTINGVCRVQVTSGAVATALNGASNYNLKIPLVDGLIPKSTSGPFGVISVQKTPSFTTEAYKHGSVVYDSTGITLFLANAFNGYTVVDGDDFYFHFTATYETDSL